MGLRTASAALLAGLLVSACKPTSGPAAPSLAVQIERDMAGADAFAWSADRRLRWSDFESAGPRAGDEGALTAYSIFYGVRCTGETFSFLAVAGFLPHESWVRPDVTGDAARSARTLRHEQTHFDLTEVFARRLRQAFAGLYEPCRRADQDLEGLAAQYVRSEKADQMRYDEETRHGLSAAAQAAWDGQVAQDLTALRAFGR